MVLFSCSRCCARCGWPKGPFNGPQSIEIDINAPAASASMSGSRVWPSMRPNKAIAASVSAVDHSGTYSLSKIGSGGSYWYFDSDIYIRLDTQGIFPDGIFSFLLSVEIKYTSSARDDLILGDGQTTSYEGPIKGYFLRSCNLSTRSWSYPASGSGVAIAVYGTEFSAGVNAFWTGPTGRTTGPALEISAGGGSTPRYFPTAATINYDFKFVTSKQILPDGSVDTETITTTENTFGGPIFVQGSGDSHTFRLSALFGIQEMRLLYPGEPPLVFFNGQ